VLPQDGSTTVVSVPPSSTLEPETHKRKKKQRKPVSKLPTALQKYVVVVADTPVWSVKQLERNVRISKALRQILGAKCCHPLDLLRRMTLTTTHWIDYAKHIDQQEYGDCEMKDTIMRQRNLRRNVFLFPQRQMIRWLAAFIQRALVATKTTFAGAFVFPKGGLTELFLNTNTKPAVTVKMLQAPRCGLEAERQFDTWREKFGNPRVMYVEWSDNVNVQGLAFCILSNLPDVLFIAGSFHALDALNNLNNLLLSSKYGFTRQVYQLDTATTLHTIYDVAQPSALLLVYCAKNIDAGAVFAVGGGQDHAVAHAAGREGSRAVDIGDDAQAAARRGRRAALPLHRKGRVRAHGEEQ